MVNAIDVIEFTFGVFLWLDVALIMVIYSVWSMRRELKRLSEESKKYEFGN